MLKRVTEYAATQGIPKSELLGVAGLPSEALSDPHILLDGTRLARMYAFVAEHLDDPLLGLSLATATTNPEYGVCGYILQNSATVDEGYANVCRYASALLSPARIEYERRGPRVVIKIRVPQHARGTALIVQDLVAALYLAGHRSSGQTWTALSTHFAAPSPHPEKVDAFFGCTTTWESEYSAVMHMRAGDVRHPIPNADPALLQHLLEAVENQVGRRRRARGEVHRMLHLRGCVVDLEEGMVRRGPQTFSLTTRERSLLDYFHRRANQTVTHGDLERDLWNIGRTVISHAPAVAIRRLRQKIEPPSERPVNLVTVFGEGWRLNIARAESEPLSRTA